jgi:hypothetical protein
MSAWTAKKTQFLLQCNCCLADHAENTVPLLFKDRSVATATVNSFLSLSPPSNGCVCHSILWPRWHNAFSCANMFSRVSIILFTDAEGHDERRVAYFQALFCFRSVRARNIWICEVLVPFIVSWDKLTNNWLILFEQEPRTFPNWTFRYRLVRVLWSETCSIL